MELSRIDSLSHRVNLTALEFPTNCAHPFDIRLSEGTMLPRPRFPRLGTFNVIEISPVCTAIRGDVSFDIMLRFVSSEEMFVKHLFYSVELGSYVSEYSTILPGRILASSPT